MIPDFILQISVVGALLVLACTMIVGFRILARTIRDQKPTAPQEEPTQGFLQSGPSQELPQDPHVPTPADETPSFEVQCLRELLAGKDSIIEQYSTLAERLAGAIGGAAKSDNKEATAKVYAPVAMPDETLRNLLKKYIDNWIPDSGPIDLDALEKKMQRFSRLSATITEQTREIFMKTTRIAELENDLSAERKASKKKDEKIAEYEARETGGEDDSEGPENQKEDLDAILAEKDKILVELHELIDNQNDEIATLKEDAVAKQKTIDSLTSEKGSLQKKLDELAAQPEHDAGEEQYVAQIADLNQKIDNYEVLVANLMFLNETANKKFNSLSMRIIGDITNEITVQDILDKDERIQDLENENHILTERLAARNEADGHSNEDNEALVEKRRAGSLVLDLPIGEKDRLHDCFLTRSLSEEAADMAQKIFLFFRIAKIKDLAALTEDTFRRLPGVDEDIVSCAKAILAEHGLHFGDVAMDQDVFLRAFDLRYVPVNYENDDIDRHPVLDADVNTLDIDGDVVKKLYRVCVMKIKDLISKTEYWLLKYPSFTPRDTSVIRDVLRRRGLDFDMTPLEVRRWAYDRGGLGHGRASLLDIPISDRNLDFSKYTVSTLRNNEIKTVGDIVKYTVDEFSGLYRVGNRVMDEVESALSRLGLSFKDSPVTLDFGDTNRED